LIEEAYRLGEAMGLSVRCTGQAGPSRAVPQPGTSWRPEGHPARRPHESIRDGTAKVMTPFHPADGQVRLKGTTACPDGVLHGRLKQELSAALATSPMPPAPPGPEGSLRSAWEHRQEGLSIKPTLAAGLPPPRMPLVPDNPVGHKAPAFVLWLSSMAIMPLSTPPGGSWLDMVGSLQRILKRRASDGPQPGSPQEIIGRFEAVGEHWDRPPTPFIWGGRRQARRQRQRARRGPGGSGARACRAPRSRQRGYGHGQRE
jgi:hypothetical protein